MVEQFKTGRRRSGRFGKMKPKLIRNLKTKAEAEPKPADSSQDDRQSRAKP